MKNFKHLFVMASFVFILIALIFFAQPVKAVTISQLLPEFNAKPGETIEQVVQLYDDSLGGVTVYPVVYNFTSDPEREGTIKILTDSKDLKPDRAWLKYDLEELELPADGSLVDFPYRIELPANAEPGTHLISLVFQTKPIISEDTEGSAVYVGTNVATNIFLKVLGATIDDIDVDFKVGSYTNTDTSLSPAAKAEYFVPKTFFIKPPAEFLAVLTNEGNTHQKPDGNISIVNDLWGNSPEKIYVNSENRIILPGTERTFEIDSFGQGLMFGKYRAKITLLYGNPLQPVNKEITFWIVPVVEIAIVLGVILFIIIIIIVIVKYRGRMREKRELAREEKLRKEIIEQINGKKDDEEIVDDEGEDEDKDNKPKPKQKNKSGNGKKNKLKSKN